MKLKISQQIFENSSNIKCQQNPSSGSQVVSCGQMDEHDEAKIAFRKFAMARKKAKQKFACIITAII
jgi:hypothetical protein